MTVCCQVLWHDMWPFDFFSEPIVEEDEEPSNLLFGREGWNRRTFPLPTSTPLGGLPTIAQSPYGSMSSLRQSQDSLRASQEQLRSSQEGSKYPSIFEKPETISIIKGSKWWLISGQSQNALGYLRKAVSFG